MFECCGIEGRELICRGQLTQHLYINRPRTLVGCQLMAVTAQTSTSPDDMMVTFPMLEKPMPLANHFQLGQPTQLTSKGPANHTERKRQQTQICVCNSSLQKRALSFASAESDEKHDALSWSLSSLPVKQETRSSRTTT